MAVSKRRSYFQYYLLIVFLAVSLILINYETSEMVSTIQTQKFLDEEIKYFENIKKVTNIEAIESITSPMQQFHDQISIFKALSIILLVMGGGTMIGDFVFMYRYSKQEVIENKYESHINFANTTSFSILITLFFSVGLAFYFSAYLDITSYQQIATTILSQITEQNAQTKISLLNEYLPQNVSDYYNSVFNSDYFFEIFIFLSVGFLLKHKNPFFSRTFFVSSLLSTFFWIVVFAIEPILR